MIINRLFPFVIQGEIYVQWSQGHYREVARWEIFMEQEIRFGLDLGRLAILKKKLGANYEQCLSVVFSCFQMQKKIT